MKIRWLCIMFLFFIISGWGIKDTNLILVGGLLGIWDILIDIDHKLGRKEQ